MVWGIDTRRMQAPEPPSLGFSDLSIPRRMLLLLAASLWLTPTHDLYASTTSPILGNEHYDFFLGHEPER
jgi:hypothetical protein